MKKFSFLSIITTLLISVLAFGCKDDDQVLNQQDYPNEILNYISLHFPNNTVNGIVREEDDGKHNYKVALSGNIKLEFNDAKNVTDIDGGGKALPNSVIPQKIRDYVTANYANQAIIEWELDGSNQQVEIANGTNLEFDMNGSFIRIDK
jgi:hypothetical protein